MTTSLTRRTRAFAVLSLATLVLAWLPTAAQAQASLGERVVTATRGPGRQLALVIGNAVATPGRASLVYSASPLLNAARDAAAVGEALAQLGFEVSAYDNLSQSEFRRRATEFLGSVRRGDTVFIYYAGHGVQVRGENFLLPVDFDASGSASLSETAYSATALAGALSDSGADLGVLVLDACRDNPFDGRRRPGGGRSIADAPGLAPMDLKGRQPEEKGPATAAGMLIQFATGSGLTADDGLFARHLVRALSVPGLTVEALFSRVRQGVNAESGGKQIPMTVSSVVRDVFFLPPEPSPSIDDAVWQAVKDSNDAEPLDDFAAKYPNSPHAEDAVARASHLREETAGAAERRRRDEASVRATLQAYATAATNVDVEALRRLFPSMSVGQLNEMKGMRHDCRPYSVRIEPVKIFQEEGQAIVQTRTEYECNGRNSSRQVAGISDVFRLQRVDEKSWIVLELGAFNEP